MLEPKDLPGLHGRAVRALDDALRACHCDAVVGGGWAVIHHGFKSRVTRDIDTYVALPKTGVNAVLHAAAVNGFEVPWQPKLSWPTLRRFKRYLQKQWGGFRHTRSIEEAKVRIVHRETGVIIDILPAGERCGSVSCLSPTVIPHPASMGAVHGFLRFMAFASLIEMKLAAPPRRRDEIDIRELIRANPDRIDEVRCHLRNVHAQYVERFEALFQQESHPSTSHTS
jgi:hypothetical protein